LSLLSLGIPNFPDSSRKRKDFLDTGDANLIAAPGMQPYPEENERDVLAL
jgi:hypothetical protein